MTTMKKVGFSSKKTVQELHSRTAVSERRTVTLVREAARTMLLFSKSPDVSLGERLWATACNPSESNPVIPQAVRPSARLMPFAAADPRTICATDALWCFYNSVLSKVEPKNFQSAATKDCWFQAMQDEIYEFDRLDVWELVPPPDSAMIIALKWIYKVKLDEYGDVLKNKARLYKRLSYKRKV
ncbi:retrovirus-related pol polyprotein from transposon TNT 1-94 [Tanacetum coccineum]